MFKQSDLIRNDKNFSIAPDLLSYPSKYQVTYLLIDSETLEKPKPLGCTIRRLYGLPKVHKQGIPLRPVLDMHNFLIMQ